MMEIKIGRGQIFWVIKHMPILAVAIAGLAGLLFYILTCLIRSDKITKRYGCIIAVCYFVFMIILMNEGLIRWIIKKTIAVLKRLDTTQKVAVSFLGIGIAGIFIIIWLYFMTLIEKKTRNIEQEKLKEGKIILIQILFMVITIITLSHLIYLFTDAFLAPVIGADANQYMSEALAFAKEMHFSAISSLSIFCHLGFWKYVKKKNGSLFRDYFHVYV